MQIKAALFDLDGTLVDSMWVWDRLLLDFLQDQNLPTQDGLMKEVAHMSPQQSSVYVKEKYKLSLSAEEIHQTWMEMAYFSYAEKVALKNGAKEYLAILKEKGVKLAIVTACDPRLLKACLTHVGVYDLFDAVVYVDDVGKGKNFPDIYIEALKRLNTAPKDAVLFEDILVGIRTAKKLGLQVVAVEEVDQEDVEALKKESDLYIHDFTELL